VYRFSLPSTRRSGVAPAPDHSWQQAERILEILEREQAGPTVPGILSRAPKPVDLDAWLTRPLRESDYLRAYGIRPDDPFWDRYDPEGSKLGLGSGGSWRTWDFNPEKHGDQPTEVALFGNEEPPAAPIRPAGLGADGGSAHAAPPSAQTAGDDVPRIVAVTPHRSDHDITEEILAKLAKEEPDRAPDRQPAWLPGMSNLFGLIGSAEAQTRNRVPRPELTVAQQFYRDTYGLLQRRLSGIEPNNPMLTTIQPHGYAPTRENVEELQRELLEAEGRASRGEPPRPQGYLGPLPRRRGGETEYTITGRAAHKEIQERLKKEGYSTEHRLDSGRRIDAHISRGERDHIKEIRSDNPRKLSRAERDAQLYAKENEAEKGRLTTWELELYNLLEFWKRMFPGN